LTDNSATGKCSVDTGGSGSGAPDDADYLVGTTNGDLSAEIVVGTSPGGELGGTWGTPTLDDSVSVTDWNLTTPTITTQFTLTAQATPTTDADGEVALDTDGWGSGFDALEFFNGTASAYLVATTASDTPSNGQVPKFNTGGSITWEDDGGGAAPTIVLSAQGASTLGGAGAARQDTNIGSNVAVPILRYSGSADQTAFWIIVVPASLSGSTMTCNVYWTNDNGTSSSSDGVHWDIYSADIADDATWDGTFGSAGGADDLWTANDDLMISPDITVTHGFTAGHLGLIKVVRATGDSDDDLADDAEYMKAKCTL
jgi:hypothetical protein